MVETDASETALKMVRYQFNPSQRGDVADIKLAAAHLITLLERQKGGPGAREAAIAITHVQTASMFGVAAATADL